MTHTRRPALHRWTRREYARLIDRGLLHEDDPIELLDGLLLVKEPQHSPHRTAVLLVARAGIADYWIVNLLDRVLEVHREPARPGPARRRWGYASIEVLGADQSVAALAAPLAVIATADFLP